MSETKIAAVRFFNDRIVCFLVLYVLCLATVKERFPD